MRNLRSNNSEEVVTLCGRKEEVAVGSGLPTRVNANVGTSTYRHSLKEELEKAKAAAEAGADVLSDCSVGEDLDRIRRELLRLGLPVITAPIYQAASEVSAETLTAKRVIDTIEKQTKDKVAAVLLHAALSQEVLAQVKREKRVMGLVSKGGSMTARWMLQHHKENPFLEKYAEILKLLKDNEVVLCLGNAVRAGCIHDQWNQANQMELKLNVKLAKQARRAGVPVIIEGLGGHIAMDRIEEYVQKYKRTSPYPLFVAGPLPTDIALGYDHLAACVGGSLAAGAGADMLCYITAAEHLDLPTKQQVYEGVIACRIAAHLGDQMKYGLAERDRELAKARRKHDWKKQLQLALDNKPARKIKFPQKGCGMCGKYCALDAMREYLD